MTILRAAALICLVGGAGCAVAPTGGGNDYPEVASSSAAASMTARINAERNARNLRPLSRSAALDRAAAAHARDMVANDFFSHTGTDGSRTKTRVARTGYPVCGTAENIAWGQRSEAKVHAEWMNSPGHRFNILLPAVTQYGMARAESAKGPFWVQVFAKGGC